MKGKNKIKLNIIEELHIEKGTYIHFINTKHTITSWVVGVNQSKSTKA